MANHCDVLIIGGGVIGLAIALELRLRGAVVTVLTRNFAESAAHAAAGMLAPQAEQIPAGAMLELCLQSRNLYPSWVHQLEELSGMATGYWACGILAPVYQSVGVKPASQREQRCDRQTLDQIQPGLGSEVVGGWWYPKDAQVDNRALVKALWHTVQTLGVTVQAGVTVQPIQHQQDQITSVQTSHGEWRAAHHVLATGAWSQELLPVPVTPRKGQMFSVQVSEANLPLQTVLFGSDIYIVPRQNGQIIVGATSENVGFTAGNTFAGVQTLLAAAVRLYPRLQQYPIQSCWWGFRPATPDEQPILGASPYRNLTLATGHYRNGILLAPITAQLIADWVWSQQGNSLLTPFSWSRFTQQASEQLKPHSYIALKP
jgi:thiazole synthase